MNKNTKAGASNRLVTGEKNPQFGNANSQKGDTKTEQAHFSTVQRLSKVGAVDYTRATTQTSSGHRNRYPCGIFLPHAYQNMRSNLFTGAIMLSKLVARAIRGNKALRTNNATRLDARVEPLLHLSFFNTRNVLHSLLTKHLEGIPMLYKFLIQPQGRNPYTLQFYARTMARAFAFARGADATALLIARLPNTQGVIFYV